MISGTSQGSAGGLDALMQVYVEDNLTLVHRR